MTEITYRVATPADSRALAELRYTFRTSLGEAAESRAEFLERCTDWMRDRLNGRSWLAWLAVQGAAPVGCVWLQPIEKIPNPVVEPELHSYITNFYVVPELRERGIGHELLRMAVEWCHAQQVDSVILWPTEQSRSLYERHGFAARNALMELRLGISGQATALRSDDTRTGGASP